MKRQRTRGAKYLPTDILFWNILIRLPVKSLKRFQCVHKSWNDLIKDPNFVAQHLQFHNRNNPNQYCFLASIRSVFTSGHSLKFLNFDGCTIIDSIDSLDWPKFSAYLSKFSHHIGIRGPSNGIYCFTDVDVESSPNCKIPKSIVLANISLREFKVVPSPPDQHSILSRRPNFFHPYYYIEFGFDHKANDYKVVLIITYISDLTDFSGKRSFEVAVYSLRSNSWKKLREYQTLQDTLCIYNQYSADSAAVMNTFVHGNFHWVARSRDGEDCIISFDIVREVFGKIKLTPRLSSRHKKAVVEFNESLRLLSFRPETKIMKVWVMQEYGKEESWTKLHTIYPIEVTSRGWGKPIGFLPNGRTIHEGTNWLIINDGNGGSTKFVRRVDAAASTQKKKKKKPLKLYSTRIYSESLVSLKDYEGL